MKIRDVRYLAILILLGFVFGAILVAGCATESYDQGAEQPYGYGDVER